MSRRSNPYYLPLADGSYIERAYRVVEGERVPRGNWKWKVYDPTRRPKTATVNLRTKDRGAALRLANEHVTRMASGAFDPWRDAAPKRGVTLDEARETFLSYKASQGSSPATVETDRGHLARFSSSLGAHALVQHVEPRHVQAFLDAPKKDGSLRSEEYKGRIRASLSHFFSWAVGAGLIRENPAEATSVKGAASKAREHLTEAEEEALLSAARQERVTPVARPHWVSDWVVFGCRTGLRPLEQKALQWHAIDLAEGNVHVGKGHRVKTKDSVRVVPVVGDALGVLRRLAASAPAPTSPVFLGATGGDVSLGYLTKRLKALAVQAGIHKTITAYSTRHSYGTRLIANGVSIWDAAKLMGTSVSMIEKHYGHHDPSRSRDHIERVFGRSSRGSGSSG